jgi:hypothetical protein
MKPSSSSIRVRVSFSNNSIRRVDISLIQQGFRTNAPGARTTISGTPRAFYRQTSYTEKMDATEHLRAEDLPEFPELDSTGTVDLSQLRCHLALTPAERLRRLDEWVHFVKSARRSFIDRYGFDPTDSAAIE